MSKDDTIQLDILMPVLETPPPSESPGSNVGGIFGDDSLAVCTAKLAASEAFLGLITRDLPFQDFMREILMTFMKVVKSEAGSILEVDHHNQTLFFRAMVGTSSDKLNKFTVPMGQGIVGHVAESKQALVVSDVEENRVHLKAIEKAVGFETRNLVAVPILIRGRIFGVLELLNRVGESTYTAADVELLGYIADAAAKSIECRLMLAWALDKSSHEKTSKDAA